MAFRLPVLDRYQFLEVSPIQKGTESSNLASGNSLSGLFLDDFAFLGFPRAWNFSLAFYLIPSHRQKIQNPEASWSLGTGSPSFRSTHILYCANSASDRFFIGSLGFFPVLSNSAMGAVGQANPQKTATAVPTPQHRSFGFIRWLSIGVSWFS